MCWLLKQILLTLKQLLLKAQNAANLAEASLNQVIAYPVQTAINTAEHDLQYKPYNVTLEQAKAYALLHRSALVKSALDVKSAEEAVKSAKSGYLPTVAVKAGRGYADPDGYFGTSTKSWSVGCYCILEFMGRRCYTKCY